MKRSINAPKFHPTQYFLISTPPIRRSCEIVRWEQQ